MEKELRKSAIERYLKGESPKAIYTDIGRSNATSVPMTTGRPETAIVVSCSSHPAIGIINATACSKAVRAIVHPRIWSNEFIIAVDPTSRTEHNAMTRNKRWRPYDWRR